MTLSQKFESPWFICYALIFTLNFNASFLCPGIVLPLPVHVSVEIFILAITCFAYIQALSLVLWLLLLKYLILCNEGYVLLNLSMDINKNWNKGEGRLKISVWSCTITIWVCQLSIILKTPKEQTKHLVLVVSMMVWPSVLWHLLSSSIFHLLDPQM